MFHESLIPGVDLVGTVGFLVAIWIGTGNYRASTVERPFWLAFVLSAGLGALWLGLVAVEWLGFHSVFVDQFNTTIQAVVIGLYAIGVVGTWSITQDLGRSRREIGQRAALISVLSRVLRHNLRNEMTVIRGYIAMAADTFAEPDVVTDQIDDLIEMTEKARKLEETMRPAAAETVDLGEIVRIAVEDVRADHPEATITLDVAAGLPAVDPSLRIALTELVENAVQHTGDRPDVVVTAENDAETVTVHIADDGPGLPEQERGPLTGAIETPLAHGSGIGLWMARWIVAGLGGEITAQVTDEGTRVSIALPRDAPGQSWETRTTAIHPGNDRYHAIFIDGVDAHLVVSAEGRILDANELASAVFEDSRRGLLGRPLASLLTAGVDGLWADLQRDEIGTGELSVVGDDRTYRYVAVTNVVLGEHLLTIRDVKVPAGGE